MPADPAPRFDTDAQFSVAGLAEAVGRISDPREERRLIFAKGENTRHVRHAQVLDRWPLLDEPWARNIEKTRIGNVDRNPANAGFAHAL